MDEDRRAQILEAASRLFRHYGPFKTTVQDIAREAGIGVGTIYLEFKNKDAILTALASHRHRVVLETVEKAWGDGRPAARCLERALNARVKAFLMSKDDGAHGIDLLAGGCDAIEREHETYRERERQLFARFLREAHAAKELDCKDADDTARALLLAYHAFAPPIVFALPLDAVERDLKRLHRIVFDGLLPRR